MSADAPLDPQDLERLRALAAGRPKAQLGELVSGVGAKAMIAALAGLPVRAATRELIRRALEVRAAADRRHSQICLCPASSEYDPPCPRHGVLGIGVTGARS